GVSILLNAGNGAFVAQPDLDLHTVLAASAYPEIASGDLDGDGNMDLVVTRPAFDSLCVLRNLGGAAFAPPVDYSFASNSEPAAVLCADLDHDGDLDLAVGEPGVYEVGVLLNAGNGSFAPPVPYGSILYPGSVTSGDLDADGLPDVIVADT